jgi:Mg-chelatase subunit ChlD
MWPSNRNLVLLLVFYTWPFFTTYAQVAIQAAGADIMAVIDQSGSMSGQGAATVANDRHGRRISFFQSFTPKLIDSARRGMTNRLSVIEFGGRNARDPHDRPQITLSKLVILPFGPNVPNRSEDDVRGDIEAGLIKVQPANRGDTDHAEALRLAAQEITRLSTNPPQIPVAGEDGDRKRIVLLITDGRSYAAGVPYPKMLQETERHVKSFPTGTVFMVLGLNQGKRVI